jgi:hypothetical protein
MTSFSKERAEKIREQIKKARKHEEENQGYEYDVYMETYE